MSTSDSTDKTTPELNTELQSVVDSIQERTGKNINVVTHNNDLADITIEGYTARQTEQILTSDIRVTSLGRDDFRNIVRVATSPSPIRDRYCIDINEHRTAYYD